MEGRHLRHRPELAVIAEGQTAVRQGLGEGGLMDGLLIEVLLHPGMDGQLRDGVAVVDGQDPGELVLLPEAQAGLDGDGDGEVGGKDRLKEAVQLIGLRQEAGALSFRHHSAGGAAQVQVHLGIAQVREIFRRPEEVLRPAGHELRHHEDAPVGGGIQIPPVPLRNALILGGGEEGGVVFLHPAEHLLMEPAPEPGGDALHGGGVVSHGGASSSFGLGMTRKAARGPSPRRGGFRCGFGNAQSRRLAAALSFSRTSWAPPSTMEVAETRVSLAFSRSSGMVRAPQLHMVERILASVVAIPSDSAPA